jgi:hypothetical protein
MPDEAPVIIRLRRFLKQAIRAWGLKCIDIRELKPEKDRQ